MRTIIHTPGRGRLAARAGRPRSGEILSPCGGEDEDLARACVQEHARAGRGGRARGEDVVYEQHALAADERGRTTAKEPSTLSRRARASIPARWRTLCAARARLHSSRRKLVPNASARASNAA